MHSRDFVYHAWGNLLFLQQMNWDVILYFMFNWERLYDRSCLYIYLFAIILVFMIDFDEWVKQVQSLRIYEGFMEKTNTSSYASIHTSIIKIWVATVHPILMKISYIHDTLYHYFCEYYSFAINDGFWILTFLRSWQQLWGTGNAKE